MALIRVDDLGCGLGDIVPAERAEVVSGRPGGSVVLDCRVEQRRDGGS